MASSKTITNEIHLSLLNSAQLLRVRNSRFRSTKATSRSLNPAAKTAQRYSGLRKGSVNRFCTNNAARLRTKLEAREYLDIVARGEDKKFFNPIEMFAELVRERRKVESAWSEKNEIIERDDDGENDDDDDTNTESTDPWRDTLIKAEFAEEVVRRVIDEGEELRKKVVDSIGRDKFDGYINSLR